VTTTAKRKPPPRKGTAPRKAATRVAANGASNGSPPVVPPEKFVYDPRPAAPGTSDPWNPPAPDPDEFVPTTKPEAVVESANPPGTPDHPYGDRKVFVFIPEPGSKAGDEPIVFPDITTVRPDYHFMWKIRKLDQVQQSFEWMDMAQVPDPIQERVTLLPDSEQARFFLGWFSAAVSPQTQVGPPGES
jgi:hypothetical protein